MMTHLRPLACLFAIFFGIFLPASRSPLLGTEQAITLKGRVDQVFITLGTHADFLRERSSLAKPLQLIVIEPPRSETDEVELDRVIERLGRLIRDAEREKDEK
jgi:hypothetical protein